MNFFAEYLQLHAKCKLAITEFQNIKSEKNKIQLNDWTKNYEQLYKEVSVRF